MFLDDRFDTTIVPPWRRRSSRGGAFLCIAGDAANLMRAGERAEYRDYRHHHGGRHGNRGQRQFLGICAMSEVTDFIAAIVAIAKDPKAWEKRLGDADDIAKQLAEARRTKKEAEDAAKAAAADLETARYERGQAE